MKFGDVEFLIDRVDVPLAAAKCDGGDAVGGEPIGVQAAIGNGELRFVALGLDGCRRRDDAWLFASQPKRFVIELTFDRDFSTLAGRVAAVAGSIFVIWFSCVPAWLNAATTLEARRFLSVFQSVVEDS